MKDVKVYGDEGAINVTDIEEATSVQIFNAEGKLIERESGVFGRSRYYVPEGEVYIVKVGQRTFKLAM